MVLGLTKNATPTLRDHLIERPKRMNTQKMIWFSVLLLFTQVLMAGGVSSEPIRHVKTTEKVVALTFDDGPGDFTDQVLSVLNKHGVKATFYVLGGNAKAYPDKIKKIMKEGHDLGNHTMYHDKMKNKSVEKITHDIQSVDTILRNLGYQREITFRAPFGITSENLKIALQNLNKRMVLFTFLPQDWTKISAQTIHDNVMKEMKPGLIITLHDGGNRRQNTVIATDMLINTLQKQGYRFVTISELLKLKS